MLRLLFFVLKTIFSATLYVVGFLLGQIYRLLSLAADRLLELIAARRSLGTTIRCPRGCPPQSADGWYTCTVCKGRFEGWIWQPCPGCGARAGQATCETCGHLIRGPEGEV